MSWTVSADPLEFAEAEKWFASREVVTEEALDYAGDRAWTISGVAQMSVVQDAFDSIADAVRSGLAFAAWKKAASERLARAWGGRRPARLIIVFRNAAQQSYNAGRYTQLTHPDVQAARPYWMFDGVVDSRTTDICRALDGLVLPANDPAWATRHPQLHHGCRSTIRSLTESQALARGISQTLPEQEPAGGFGKRPDLFAWKPDPTDYQPSIWAEYERKHAQTRG